ncbi:HAD hydrolase family protein [Micromonospora halotolerans]|uniref:HAD hydrolase family protein n=1 Tax=Micromonospora halotolerans TaxID=709879 RepID=A0ABY9ZRL4_9ACTN|nr:HAD hydrolase family protein [Micromonospora halotolerans]WNM37944.1 HAD hydrolase family protein [Micromonospora halotolerans]
MNRTDLPEAASWIVALDLDGTTRRKDGSISGAVIKQVRRLPTAGHHVVLTTGRSSAITIPVLDQLGIAPRFLVCFNGAVILHRDPGAPRGYRREWVESGAGIHPTGFCANGSQPGKTLPQYRRLARPLERKSPLNRKLAQPDREDAEHARPFSSQTAQGDRPRRRAVALPGPGELKPIVGDVRPLSETAAHPPSWTRRRERAGPAGPVRRCVIEESLWSSADRRRRCILVMTKIRSGIGGDHGRRTTTLLRQRRGSRSGVGGVLAPGL